LLVRNVTDLPAPSAQAFLKLKIRHENHQIVFDFRFYDLYIPLYTQQVSKIRE